MDAYTNNNKEGFVFFVIDFNPNSPIFFFQNWKIIPYLVICVSFY